MSYLYDLLFAFSLIKTDVLAFLYFLEYLLLFLDDNVGEESE